MQRSGGLGSLVQWVGVPRVCRPLVGGTHLAMARGGFRHAAASLLDFQTRLPLEFTASPPTSPHPQAGVDAATKESPVVNGPTDDTGLTRKQRMLRKLRLKA